MFKENIINNDNNDPEISEDEIMHMDPSDFILDNEYSSDQLREAYYRLLGVEKNPSNDPEIEKLYAALKEVADKGYPLNKIAKAVGVLEDLEEDEIVWKK